MAFNTIVDTIAPALADLDLLSDDDLERARKLTTEATKYRALAANADQHVTAKIGELADKLTPDPKTTADKIIAASVNVPNADAITAVATAMERSLNRQARQLVLTRVDEVPAKLNARLVEIADQTAELAVELANISTPQEAIDGGRVDEWRTAHALMGEYSAIHVFVRELRSEKLLAAPTSRNSGPYWMFLLDADPDVRLTSDASKWRHFVADAARRPWVPASAEEATAVAKSWGWIEETA